MGMQSLNNFRANLVQELDVTYDQALKIAFDANAQIFGPVMNELRQVQEGKIETTPPLTAEVFTPTESKPEPIRPEPVNPFIPNPSKAGVVKRGQKQTLTTCSWTTKKRKELMVFIFIVRMLCHIRQIKHRRISEEVSLIKNLVEYSDLQRTHHNQADHVMELIHTANQ